MHLGDQKMGTYTKLALPTQEGIELFDLSEIVRSEAHRAYCIFHLTNGRKVVISRSLSEYDDMLTKANFYRIHKSHLINMSHVVSCTTSDDAINVKLSDHTKLEVAIRRKDGFMRYLKNHPLVINAA